jgi:hypothetical protein
MGERQSGPEDAGPCYGGDDLGQLDTNVRDDAALDAHFVASIREHGLLQFNSPEQSRGAI